MLISLGITSVSYALFKNDYLADGIQFLNRVTDHHFNAVFLFSSCNVRYYRFLLSRG